MFAMLSTLLPVLLAFHAAPPLAVSRPVIQQSPSFAASSTSVAPRMSFDIGVALYEAQLSADALVKTQLASLTPLSALVLYSAGLVTSLTPCCLSMLPLTVAYLGGLEEDDEGVGGAAGNGAALPAFFCCFTKIMTFVKTCFIYVECFFFCSLVTIYRNCY